jgi:hypothetical protein
MFLATEPRNTMNHEQVRGISRAILLLGAWVLVVLLITG